MLVLNWELINMSSNQQKYSIVLDGVNKLSAPLAGAGKALNKLESDAAGTNNQLSKFQTQQKNIAGYQLAQATLKKTRTEMKSLSQASSELSNEINQAKLALSSQEQALDKARVNLARLRSETELSEKVSKSQRAELRAAEKQVKELQKNYSSQEKQVNDLNNALRRNENQLGKSTKKMSSQSAQIGQLKHQLSSAGVNTNALGAEQLRLAKKTDAATLALTKQKASLKELRAIEARKGVRAGERGELAGQAMGTAVAAMPLLGVGSRAVDFQSAFLDIKKVVSFDSAEDEHRFTGKMKSLATETGMSQIGMAEIVASAGKSGIGSDKEKTAQENQADLLKFARESAEMAVAFGIDAAKAGETLATFQASMGLEGDKALSLAKTANLLADNLANTDPKQIAEILAKEGATAMSAGLSAIDTAALAGSLFSADGSEDRSATALKGITGALTKGFSATGAQKEAYGMLGLDADDIAAGMQDDARGTIIEVFTALKEADAVDRSALVSQLFGDEAKGAVTKLIGSMDGDKGLVATMKLAGEAAKAASAWEGELSGRRGSAQFKLDAAKSSLDRMITALGDGFLPIIDVAAPMVTTVAESIAGLLEQTPELATGLAVLTAGAIAAKTAIIGFKLGKNILGAGKDLLTQKKLTSSVLSTSNAAKNASRNIDRLNRKLNGLGAGSQGGGGYQPEGRSSKGKRRGGRLASVGKSLGRNKWARRAGFLTGATALTLMPGAASAADTLTMGGDLVDGIGGMAGLLPKAGMLAGVGSLAGKLVKPLGIAASSLGLVDAINGGDAKDVGGAAGDLTGGIGGAMAGAALGTLILPGIGTAIGGMLGGIGGGAAGEWLGEKIGGLFSKNQTDAPMLAKDKKQIDQIANAAVKKEFKQEINVQVSLTPTGDAAYDAKLAEDAAQKTSMAIASVAPPDLELAMANTLGDT